MRMGVEGGKKRAFRTNTRFYEVKDRAGLIKVVLSPPEAVGKQPPVQWRAL